MVVQDADPKVAPYNEVSHILLDPSCSSSGMSTDPFTDEADLAELSTNQHKLILHAMSFPSVNVVVYSTCSIYERENEQVVRRVLADAPHFVLDVALPWWERRGHARR